MYFHLLLWESLCTAQCAGQSICFWQTEFTPTVGRLTSTTVVTASRYRETQAHGSAVEMCHSIYENNNLTMTMTVRKTWNALIISIQWMPSMCFMMTCLTYLFCYLKCWHVDVPSSPPPQPPPVWPGGRFRSWPADLCRICQVKMFQGLAWWWGLRQRWLFIFLKYSFWILEVSI